MKSVILTARFRSLVSFLLLIVLLLGALWLSGLDRRVVQGQGTISTFPPDQITAIAATVEAINATATANAFPPLYDDFEAAILDSQKWTDASSLACRVETNGGLLTISNTRTQALNCDVEVNTPLINLAALRMIEAQIMVSDRNFRQFDQGITLSTNSLPLYSYITCGVNSHEFNAAMVTGEIFSNGTLKEFYRESDVVSVADGAFYTFRWEIDPTALSATCIVDGAVIDTVQLNQVDELENALWLVSLTSYREENSVSSTSVDNFRIVWS